jgi:hypothetical protein
MNKIFLIKNSNLLIPRNPQRTSKLKETSSSLKKEHPALLNLEILHYWGVIFALLDPYPQAQSRSGSSKPKINADPDPQHCYLQDVSVSE